MKKRILFVDDEPNFLEGIRLMLRGHRDDWDLSFSHSVDEAIDNIENQHFDAVVSDVSMPVKNGLDLLQELQETGTSRRIPVIIVTGNAEKDLKSRALDLGAADLLNKPVEEADLVARLNSVIKLKGYQDELHEYNATLEAKVRERTLDLERSRRDIIWRLAKAGEFRDEETGEHVMRVACCSQLLAESAGVDAELTEMIFLTSPLHDIGKIGVPDSVLLKPGVLTAAERTIMETHCEIGASILMEEPKGMKLFVHLENDLTASDEDTQGKERLREVAAEIAMSHHEKWDGSGYPCRLAGEDISIAGRVVAISDVYDALRSARPYKKPFSVEKTLEIMREGVGTHFDPSLFDTFENVVSQFEQIRGEYADERATEARDR